MAGLRNAVQLIAYPNRIGKNLVDLHAFMTRHLSRAVGGVHILPLYPSNADGGFSPLTHKEVDPAHGTWQDVERISAQFDLCVDLTINHISDESVEFLDFVKNGLTSPFADLFVHVDALGDFGPDDLAKIHIRKEKEPFREVTFANGEGARVWCTFTPRQIDLNLQSAKTRALLADYIAFLSDKGVKLFRLDAIGYTTKKLGTSCFLVEPEIYEIMDWIRDVAGAHGAEVLPEVHDHVSFQYAIANRQMRPYGFALAPLVLYSLLDANSTYLKAWLRMCPPNMINVLDTHDGICIPDVETILPVAKIEALIDDVSKRSADPILRRSSVGLHSVGAIYQLTCTYYDALKQNDDAYIAARAIQFFAPGIPQVYYVGLLAGKGDTDLVDRTGEMRDINRSYYTLPAAAEALKQPVCKRLLRLMELRSNHSAFQGSFELQYSNDQSVSMAWRRDDSYCELFVDLIFNKATIRHREQGANRVSTLRC